MGRQSPGASGRQPSSHISRSKQQLQVGEPRRSGVARVVLETNARKDPFMRYKGAFLLAAICLMVSAAGVQAQDEKKINVSFGGGFTQPNAEVSDRLGSGYNFNFGLQVNLTPAIAIEGLYSFNGLGNKRLTIPVYPTPLASGGVDTDLFADMNMQ